MSDYRLVQLQELQDKIDEAKALLVDPAMADLANEEIHDLEEQKKVIEESISNSNLKNEEDFDSKNIVLETKGAAGGDEAKLWAGGLIRMCMRYGQKKGFRLDEL